MNLIKEISGIGRPTVGDTSSISGSGRSPGEGNVYPLQYSPLGESNGLRSQAGYSPWGRKESDMTEQLTHTHTHTYTHTLR